MPEQSTNSEDYELLLPPDQQQQTADRDIEPAMGQEEQVPKAEESERDVVLFYLSLGASITSLVITWISVLTNHPTQFGWFALHPILQSLAIALFTYGILTLQPTTQPKTKADGLARHQITVLCLAFPSIILGTCAVIHNKYLNDKPHFTSFHGQLGILCMLWMVVQMALGGGSVWADGAAFGGGMKAKLVWRYHRISGYILFPLLLATVNLGGASGWASRNVGGVFRFVAYTLGPIVIIGGVGLRVRWSKMKIF